MRTLMTFKTSLGRPASADELGHLSLTLAELPGVHSAVSVNDGLAVEYDDRHLTVMDLIRAARLAGFRGGMV